MSAQFIEKEQIWADGATRYWFDVNGEEYAVVESGCDDAVVVDSEGYPVNLGDNKNSHLRDLVEAVTDQMRAN